MASHVLLTSSQAAQALGMSVSALCRLDAEGAPVSYTPGGHRRWDIDELREWLHQRALECEEDCADEDEEGEDDDLDDSSDDDDDDAAADDDTCPSCGAELEEDDDPDGDDDSDSEARSNPSDDDNDDDDDNNDSGLEDLDDEDFDLLD